MDSKTQNILSFIMFVGLFVIGFFLYNQQKTINEIVNSISKQEPLQGGGVALDNNVIVKNNIFIAAGKIADIQDDIVSLKLKILNGESFSEPLRVVEAKITKDTSFKIFKEPKNKLGDDIEALGNGSMSDLGIGIRADFYFEKEMTDNRFDATRIVIIK